MLVLSSQLYNNLYLFCKTNDKYECVIVFLIVFNSFNNTCGFDLKFISKYSAKMNIEFIIASVSSL